MNLEQKALFDGAIIASLPKHFFDASDVRQVPDTQEVYISLDSDDSIIIEILERVSQDDSADAARFHFEAIAHDNDAVSSSVDDVNEIPYNLADEIPSIVILHGRQGVRKFNKTSVDDVRIFVALYRLKERGVDLVLSLNFPMKTGDDVIRTEQEYNTAKDIFRSIASSFQIIDFNLFG
ncbi:Mog1p/PsbP-like protein [Russula earlei]|uniref:Mog1p/PsbP-like protein n=1 Tax=Russula earlei TaxID=71964 RepID=A0ACC0UBM0_9AGAM|nr:Mog1p/PsbP-like protein [Russula earlei]